MVPALSDQKDGRYPLLQEQTPVRLDFTHSGWSDIFFLAMERPDLAQVVNAAVDLRVGTGGNGGNSGKGRKAGWPDEEPASPITSRLRLIDEPVIRLTAVDLQATVDCRQLSDVFDFQADHCGLLKAAVVASGIVPPALEGTGQSLTTLLERLCGPGRGFELMSEVHGIPKGSRLAVSTNLLASLVAILMRASIRVRRWRVVLMK